MEPKRIQSLLDAYWAGKTSRAEEAGLKRFFGREASSAEWKTEAALFRYFIREREKKLPETAVPLPLPIPRPLWARRWLQVAAVILLMTGGALVWKAYTANQLAEKQLAADTFEDPEEAYEVLREALYLVSTKMNAGKKHTGKLRQLKRASNKLKQAAEDGN